MSVINLYKIKHINAFKDKLKEKKFIQCPESRKVILNEGYNPKEYEMSFYYNKNQSSSDLSWANFANLFNVDTPKVNSRPKAIILIEKDDDFYGISFGTAYHTFNSFYDENWAFNFAKRIEFSQVQLIATTIPQSKLNKQISTYINYNGMEINSGEALSKIKAEMSNDGEQEIIKDKLQAGNSLMFNLVKDSLESIAKTIQYVEDTINTEVILHELPSLEKINDEDKIDELNNDLEIELNKLTTVYKNENIDVNNYVTYMNQITEFDDFDEFKLLLEENNGEENSFCTNEMSLDTIIEFIKYAQNQDMDVMDLIIEMKNDNQVITRKLHQCIIFDYVRKNCIYEDGKWLTYNEDYIASLEREINTIPAKFCPEYSFDCEKYESYIASRLEGDSEEVEKFKNRGGYYNETTFNEYLRDCHDYEYYDKDLWKKQGYKVEIMDLYKDKTAYAVKKGSGSEKLFYVVDQIMEGMKLFRSEECKLDKEIENVCIWIILDWEKRILHDENNNANLNKIKTMIFKRKLVEWKRQMLLWGYKPSVRINYKKRGNSDDKNIEIV